MEKSSKKINIKSIIELFLIFLILIGAVKKGGFYVTDMNIISYFIILLFILYFLTLLKDKNIKFNLSHIFLIMLFISYLLPVIFKKYVVKEDAIFEAIKYLDMFSVFFITTNSNNKKIYENFIIILGIIIGIFGIDGLANRYLAPVLSVFDSGYLSTYLDRMSSFIQYANTCAILLTVALLFAIKCLFIYIDRIKNEYNMGNIKRLELLYVSSSFLTLCILLTFSRMPILFAFIDIIIICLLSKENRLIKSIVIICQVVIALLFSDIIHGLVYKEVFDIYIMTILFVILSFIMYNILLYKVIMNVKVWYISKNRLSSKKIGKILALIGMFSVIYIIAGLNIPAKLEISENQKNLQITKKITGYKNENINRLEMKVKDKCGNSDYVIEIYERKADGSEILAAKFEDEGSRTGDFYINLQNKKDLQCYIFRARCVSGDIIIDSFKINNKRICLNYMLLPSEIVFRFKEGLLNSVSNRVRLEYIKDSIKIFKTSPLIGRGGEAFRYLYKDFQTASYNTTEAHSSFIQILIESGIFGFFFIIAWTIYIIIKSDNNINNVIFITFMLHSVFDLNFSYTISVLVASLLASCAISKKEI